MNELQRDGRGVAEHRMASVARRLVLIAVLSAVLGCGQSGPLMLPDRVPDGATTSPTDSSEDEDENRDDDEC